MIIAISQHKEIWRFFNEEDSQNSIFRFNVLLAESNVQTMNMRQEYKYEDYWNKRDGINSNERSFNFSELRYTIQTK